MVRGDCWGGVGCCFSKSRCRDQLTDWGPCGGWDWLGICGFSFHERFSLTVQGCVLHRVWAQGCCCHSVQARRVGELCSCD